MLRGLGDVVGYHMTATCDGYRPTTSDTGDSIKSRSGF